MRDALKTPGQPLDATTREWFQSRTASHLGDVTVHSDATAAESARGLHAKAYTVGRHIVVGDEVSPIGRGELDPVIAHELAHVLQQSDAPASSEPLDVGRNHDADEVSAHRLGASLVAGATTGSPYPSIGRVSKQKIQRYDAFEHANESDAVPGGRTAVVAQTRDFYTGDRSGGLRLATGEINALADLYQSADALYDADPAEVSRLLVLIHRQQADPHSVSESEWDVATNGRYTRLNLQNSSHFGPSNPALIPTSGGGGGSDNRSQFIRYYSETLVNASTAYTHLGLPSPEHTRQFLDRATVSAGFAEHFLMDAFSAGHLFNKDDFIARAQANVSALTPAQLSAMFTTVSQRVLANQTAHDLLAQYEPVEGIGLGPAQWRPNFDREFAFTELLTQLYADRDGRQAVYSALVKVVHDRLSTHDAGGGLIGVPVENDFTSWVLSGDRTLASSPDTRAQIALALARFRANIAPFFTGTQPPSGYAPGSEQVTAYFPRPSSATEVLIAGMVRNVTDPAAGLTTALSDVLIAELPSTLAALVARGRIRRA